MKVVWKKKVEGPVFFHMGVSKNSATPKWMVKIMETPIKMDDLVVPLFLVGNPHIWNSQPRARGCFKHMTFQLLRDLLSLAGAQTLQGFLHQTAAFFVAWPWPNATSKTTKIFCFFNGKKGKKHFRGEKWSHEEGRDDSKNMCEHINSWSNY